MWTRVANQFIVSLTKQTFEFVKSTREIPPKIRKSLGSQGENNKISGKSISKRAKVRKVNGKVAESLGSQQEKEQIFGKSTRRKEIFVK